MLLWNVYIIYSSRKEKKEEDWFPFVFKKRVNAWTR